jgi:hypothetical protein
MLSKNEIFGNFPAVGTNLPQTDFAGGYRLLIAAPAFRPPTEAAFLLRGFQKGVWPKGRDEQA